MHFTDSPLNWEINKEEVTASKECSITNEIYSVTVPNSNYTSWIEGEYAQKAFPQLTADQREFLISGTTPKEWSDMIQKWEE